METNKRKVLVVQGLHEQGIKMLDKRSDIEYQVIMSDDENEISDAAKDVHGITVRTANITQKIIESAKNLLVVSRHGVGYDSIDTKTLSEKKIPLTIAAHSNMISVAEHAMFFLLALSKNVFYYDDFTRKADWSTRWNIKAWDLAEKKILIIGYGRIGSRVVKRALAFEMKVYVYDPFVDNKVISSSGAIPTDNIQDILYEMDAVSIHCPRNAETENMFSKKEFDQMKNTSFIINCARGGIINEDDLCNALDNDNIAGAGLDVFDIEPAPKSNRMLNTKNVILSPHIAGVTVEATVRMAKETVQNVLDVFDEKVNENVIVNNEILRR